MSELTAAHSTIEKAREVTNCPDGVDLQEHLNALVAENAAMKSAAKEVLAHWAAAEPREMEQMMDKCMPDLRVAYCETPATDSILREAEARGVEKFAAVQRGVAERLQNRCGDVADHSIKFCLESAEEAEDFAKQLREGKA